MPNPPASDREVEDGYCTGCRMPAQRWAGEVGWWHTAVACGVATVQFRPGTPSGGWPGSWGSS